MEGQERHIEGKDPSFGGESAIMSRNAPFLLGKLFEDTL
jgi:hypothetical protein